MVIDNTENDYIGTIENCNVEGERENRIHNEVMLYLNENKKVHNTKKRLYLFKPKRKFNYRNLTKKLKIGWKDTTKSWTIEKLKLIR